MKNQVATVDHTVMNVTIKLKKRVGRKRIDTEIMINQEIMISVMGEILKIGIVIDVKKKNIKMITLLNAEVKKIVIVIKIIRMKNVEPQKKNMIMSQKTCGSAPKTKNGHKE